MKKFLSLVLALVMTMSLVTISAGAKDFTDNSKIKYQDAVDVISELDVVDGYKDGTFGPSNTLTRGAAAKIICNMILGPTTADALNASSAPFKDVAASSTFAGYITYCAKEGIINGYADGTFRPTGTLNGYAFMKMLLGALGYDADQAGFTGANWQINVAKLAIGNDLNDGLAETFNGSKAVTREEACLYAFNTLQAKMVEYDTKTTVTVNGAQVVVGGSDAKEMANTADKESFKDDNKMQFAEKYFSDLKTSDTDDDFGRPAKIWKIKNKEVGTYAVKADATYTAKVKGQEIRSDLGDSYDFEQVEKADAYFVNGKQIAIPAKFAVAKSNDVKVGGNGTLTEVYVIESKDDKKDDTVRIVSIESFLMQVSGDYDKSDKELTLEVADSSKTNPVSSKNMTISSDDFDNLDAYEDEDYVVVTVAGDEIKSIAKAEKVTASVTTYEDDDSVTAGGTKYSYSATNDESDMTYTIKNDYDLYLDAYGYVLFADGVEDEGKYVFIDDAYAASGSEKSNVQANAYFLDGTNSEIVVSKVGGTSVKGATDAKKVVDGWYTYTIKSDKYELKTATTTVKANTVADNKVTNKDNVYISVDGDSTYAKATKSTVFVVVDKDDDATVYTGTKNVPQITGTTVLVSVVFEKSSNYAKYVFIDLGSDGHTKGGSTSTDVVFVYGSGYDKRGTDADENVYYTYKAVLNGTDTKVKFDDAKGNEKLAIGMYVEVEYDSTTKYVTDYVIVDSTKKYDTDDYSYNAGTNMGVSQKNSVVTIGGESYYMADSAKIGVINDDGDMEFVTAKKLANDYDGKVDVVYGVMDSNSEYTYLFIVQKDVK